MVEGAAHEKAAENIPPERDPGSAGVRMPMASSYFERKYIKRVKVRDGYTRTFFITVCHVMISLSHNAAGVPGERAGGLTET